MWKATDKSEDYLDIISAWIFLLLLITSDPETQRIVDLSRALQHFSKNLEIKVKVSLDTR